MFSMLTALLLRAAQPDVAQARELEQRAHALQQAGNFRDAQAPLKQAIAIWTRLHGADDIEVLNDEVNLAVALRRDGNAEAAVPMLERAVDGLGRSADPDAPALRRRAQNDLAQAYRFARRPEDAKRTMLALVAQLPESPPSEERARALDNLTSLLLDANDLAGAARSAAQCLAVWRALRGEDDVDTAISESVLGTLKMRTGHVDEAGPLVDEALAVTERHLGADHPELVRMLCLHAELETRRGQPAAARADLTRAVAIGRKRLAPHHPDLQEAEDALAALDASKSK